MAVAIAHMALAIVLLPALSFASLAERVQMGLIVVALLLPLCVFGRSWFSTLSIHVYKV